MSLWGETGLFGNGDCGSTWTCSAVLSAPAGASTLTQLFPTPRSREKRRISQLSDFHLQSHLQLSDVVPYDPQFPVENCTGHSTQWFLSRGGDSLTPRGLTW